MYSYKAVFALSVLVAVLVAESSCQGYKIIRPTYRPPPKKPVIIRAIRDVSKHEPLWVNKGDIQRAPAPGNHPVLPRYIDDIKLDPNRRYARSLNSPSVKHGGDSHTISGDSKHTGLMHPGYNRRHVREIRLPFDYLPRPHRPFDPFNPIQRPGPRPLYPIYARSARNIHDEENFEQEPF